MRSLCFFFVVLRRLWYFDVGCRLVDFRIVIAENGRFSGFDACLESLFHNNIGVGSSEAMQVHSFQMFDVLFEIFLST